MNYNEFNFQLYELKSNLYNLLQESNLPLGAIFYLLKDIQNDLNNQYIATVNSYSVNNFTKDEQHTEQINIAQEKVQVE